MLALEIKDLNKTFLIKKLLSKNIKKNVLKNCNLEIKQGTVFGLAGLNGIGKTTMIKIILDLAQQDNGIVKIFNENNKNANSRKNI